MSIDVVLKLNATFTVTITESEARMLCKIAEWNTGSVYDAIQKCVSKSETECFRPTFIGFMDKIKTGTALHKLDEARKAIQ